MRTLLLPLTDEDTDEFTMRIGRDLAGRLESHLTVLLTRPDLQGVPVYAHSVTAASYVSVLNQSKAHWDLREASVKQRFVATASRRAPGFMLGTAAEDDAALEIGAGDEEDVIRRFAAVHDVIVFPRRSQPMEALAAPSLLKSALQHSGRPILVITDDIPAGFGSTVAIAWNGSTEGARAVTAALPILSRAEDVVILTVQTETTRASEAERLRTYLSRHGIEARTMRVENDVLVGEELILAAAGVGASLLVSGGYTHSRMRQTFFGGVTHHLLDNCRIPLLLAH